MCIQIMVIYFTEDTIGAESLLMGHLSPRFPRNSEGQNNNQLQIEGSTHSSGNVLTNQLLRPDTSKQYKQRLRSVRNVEMLTEIIVKCCSESCEASDFHRLDEKFRYCDTVM
jgi:hypothetical protein